MSTDHLPEAIVTALDRSPAVAGASAAGRLRLDVAPDGQPWNGGDGTRKRQMIDDRPEEIR